MICRSEPVAPTDTVFARSAKELAPSATELSADAMAEPPIATAFVPTADESGSDEFVWKYLAPRLYRFTTMSPTLLASALTFWFVAYSCAPFTASVLAPDEISPGATFVSLTVDVRSVPPRVTLSRADVSYVTTSGEPAMPLFTMLLTTFVTLARLPATFATLLATFVTFSFV